MNIKMTCIDYNKANIEQRQIFSFTKKLCVLAMEYFNKLENVLGCVIISTCNRTEVWISYEKELKFCLCEHLCIIKNVDYNYYKYFFIEKSDKEAVEHLFELACGLKSKILGEDQIITQVKNSISFSRENKCSNDVLEVLFRNAVTCAKKVKTNVKLNPNNKSIVDTMINFLRQKNINLNNKNCMVIGNGEIGKLAASALINEKANVTVTLRQYKSGEVSIPIGCSIIQYSNRLDIINKCDIVISATSSPNYTLKYDDVSKIEFNKKCIFIDLAVPRDIETKIKDIDNICMFDIDDFEIDILDDKLKKSIKDAKEILKLYISEFENWYLCRDLIPDINKIRKEAAININWKLNRYIKKLNVDDDEKEKLKSAIENAANNVVGKIMFNLRDNIEPKILKDCINIIKKGFEQNG